LGGWFDESKTKEYAEGPCPLMDPLIEQLAATKVMFAPSELRRPKGIPGGTKQYPLRAEFFSSRPQRLVRPRQQIPRSRETTKQRKKRRISPHEAQGGAEELFPGPIRSGP